MAEQLIRLQETTQAAAAQELPGIQAVAAMELHGPQEDADVTEPHGHHRDAAVDADANKNDL